jgi:hypothetical protein
MNATMGVSITFDHSKNRIPEISLHVGRSASKANARLNFGSLSLFEFTGHKEILDQSLLDLTRRCGGE